MNANTQSLGNDFTAGRTCLGCVLGIDFNKYSTGTFRLVSQIIEELRPCCIVDELIENLKPVNHLAWLKLLNENEAEGIYNLAAEFVLKVCSLVTDFCVQPAKRLFGFAGSLFGVLLMKLFEFFFGMLQMLGIFNHIAIRCDGKTLNANINTNLSGGYRQYLWQNFIARKAGVEISVLPFDRNSLYRALDLPVKLDSYGPDILDVELAAFQLNAITISWEGNRVESVFAFESWKSGCVSAFDSPEKRLECFIELAKNVLRATKIQQCKLFVKSADFLKGVGLVVIGDRLAPLLPAYDSLLQGAVIEEPGRVKETGKFGILSGIREHPVFERPLQSFSFLIFNIFSDCFFRHMPYRSSIITSAPKGRKLASEFRKFLTQNPAGISFQPVHDFSNAISRAMFEEQVDVIWHNLKSVDRKIKLIRFFIKQRFESLSNNIVKNLAPIFRTPNYVQF